MTYSKTIYIPAKTLEKINSYLQNEPASEAECLSEDETITYTASFDNGYEVDVKCCGVQYSEGESNTAWAEAVLFHNGSEVCCSEPSDVFDGTWIFDSECDSYVVNVQAK